MLACAGAMSSNSSGKTVDPFHLLEQNSPAWVERARLAAQMIVERFPCGTIADIGCGDCKLRLALPPGTYYYQGFDLIRQHSDVYVHDISKQDLPMEVDVAVMLGITEYLPDLPGVFARIAKSSRWILASHTIGSSSPQWVNRLSPDAFAAMIGGEVVEQRYTADGLTLLVLARVDKRA